MDKYKKGQYIQKGSTTAESVITGELIKKETKSGSVSKKSNDENVYTFCITSEVVDRDGDVVIQSGLKHEEFDTNPVVLWGHEWGSVPIGKVIAINKDTETKKTYADIVFGSTERAKEIETAVKDGLVRATSIGFQINDYEFLEDTYAFALTDTNLLELSLVALPANQEAVVEDPSNSKSMEEQEDEETEDVIKKDVLTTEDFREIMQSLTDGVRAGIAEAIAEANQAQESAEDDKPEDVQEPTEPEEGQQEEPEGEPADPAGEDPIEARLDKIESILSELAGTQSGNGSEESQEDESAGEGEQDEDLPEDGEDSSEQVPEDGESFLEITIEEEN